MTDTQDAHMAIQTLMQQGRFAQAVAQSDKLLKDSPKDIEGLYMKAVSARYLKDYSLAEKTLAELKTIQPNFGRALQEEGHLSRDQGLFDAALSAYQKACRANPALMASWKSQADILSRKGLRQEAYKANFQAEHLSKLPQELLTVTHLIHEGKLLKAEELCRFFLQKKPHHIEAMRLLADIGSRFGVFNDADFLLESAIEFAPDNIQLHLDYIQILRKRQKFAAALEQAEGLYKRDPENPVFQSHLAIESMQTGDHERAFALFEDVLERIPNDPVTLTSRGHAFKTFGKHDDAVESYRAAYRAKADHGDAYFGLANLKTYEFTDGEVDQMRTLTERTGTGFMDRVNLFFSLGKALEDRKDYAAAFEQYKQGNDLKSFESRYKAADMTEELEGQARICTAELFEKQGGKGFAAPDPIFIVGLPRAGSTLLEQIIASHSQVDGTLELPNILSLSYHLRGRERAKINGRYPGILHDLTEDQLKTFGERFIEDTRIHRKDAPFFIDKMPNNFRHIGLIKLILPNAKIIDARRHPMACCFSGFKQHFAEGQEFTYGLENVGTYYKDYVALMDHWDSVLPGEILRVQYEDVVGDTENQVRRILDYLGLPFEQSCLEFHKTKRSVRTASSEQVRQPIFKSGLEQWRNFEPWLDPLKEALGPEILTRYPIEPC
ncbi:tetratricopeptide repeat-containing sulfotransferase family protein [Hellea balneolensis]|uniref:tetratricopeptide repeat-containing sulfotransferase family protein n=1 Tax=Hellea balneolensis TaxID=287478 RepID=UPI000417BBF8|nr:tetratricopeptide repeat-containing sulfotransferase family protein [Hellea balneolensis]